MSEEQLKAFLEKVKGDSNLQAKLKAAKSPEDVVGIAKEHGHAISADDIKKVEVSERQLENIAGGVHGNSIFGNCNETNEESLCFECKL
ncbi:Nif11-like leader peptide family natural product precursor [Synechococcus sp. UW179A]|uniref:Nif11-like leader peptide family natural product precursor n=1 Tax=Synechococcus sp. UW179A TaxID=2575510 RepID=UPI000E0E15EF|nr:Nif11-like leader peptide family natural product precursor [Synechococcus sp. UW179A]